MDVVEPDPGLLLDAGFAHLSTVGLPAATGGDLAGLLDIHVGKIARQRAFIPHRSRLRRPDDFAGQGITLPQIWHLVTAQDRRDRASRDAELGSEPVLASALVAAQLQHPMLDRNRRSPWAVMGARRPVEQTGFALGAEPGHPPVSTLTGDS